MDYEKLVEDVRTASKEELKKMLFEVNEETDRKFKKIDDDFRERMDQLIRDYKAGILALQKDQQFFANLLINALKNTTSN